MMNSVDLIGRLTREPDLQHTQAGNPVCNISLACERRILRGDVWEKKTSFVDVAIWGSRGAAFSKHHKKGDLAAVSGYLDQDTWEDKNTKEKRTRLKVVAEEWTFVNGSKKPEREGNSPDDTPF